MVERILAPLLILAENLLLLHYLPLLICLVFALIESLMLVVRLQPSARSGVSTACMCGYVKTKPGSMFNCSLVCRGIRTMVRNSSVSL